VSVDIKWAEFFVVVVCTPLMKSHPLLAYLLLQYFAVLSSSLITLLFFFRFSSLNCFITRRE